MPIPITKTLSSTCSERKNDSWITFSVFRKTSFLTTHEMFSSEAPCAIAITFTPLFPIVEKSFPAKPVACFMFSPTMATIERSDSIAILLICPLAISRSNSDSIALRANSTTFCSIAMLIEFSDDACEIRITFTFTFASAVNSRIEIPVTPTIPIP